MDITSDNLISSKPISGIKRLQKFPSKRIEAARSVLWNLFLLASGSLICALSINGILIPHGFLSGGFVGTTLILHYLFPFLPFAGLYFLLNIPVYFLGWKYVGKRFFIYSVAGMVIFSLAVLWKPFIIPVHDKILAAIFAGLLSGAGGGIILKSFGSAGGMDILSIILFKRFAIRLGTSILGLNILILSFTAYVFSIEEALYTLIFLFVSTQVLNVVIYGLSQRKAVHIISPQWEKIYKEIMDMVQRGVTILDGRGGYSGQNIQMVFTVVSHQELPRLKKLIDDIDPRAFVVVSDTLEVMGRGIGNQPHW
jgi:uncharacterized membrane-anchored protein YitT (DUF2179 family)